MNMQRMGKKTYATLKDIIQFWINPCTIVTKFSNFKTWRFLHENISLHHPPPPPPPLEEKSYKNRENTFETLNTCGRYLKLPSNLVKVPRLFSCVLTKMCTRLLSVRVHVCMSACMRACVRVYLWCVHMCLLGVSIIDV